MYLGSMGMYLSSPRTLVALKANADDIAMGVLSMCPTEERMTIGVWSSLAYLSISLSLNVLLTLMIVVRLVMRGGNICAATGSPAGIGGLYKSIATMLIESSALFAVNSLLAIILWALKDPVVNVFTRTLAETQVRALPRLRSLVVTSHAMTEWAGHRFIAHHPKSRQQGCIDE